MCAVTVATVNDQSETVTRTVVTTQTNLSKMYKTAVITEGAEKLVASASNTITVTPAPASATESLVTSTSDISSEQVALTSSATGSGSGSGTPAVSSPAVIRNAAPGRAAGRYTVAILAMMVVAFMTV